MDIQFPQIILQLVNFSILLFFLTKLLYKPIIKVLDERADRIDKGLLAAQQNLEEKEKLESFKKSEMQKVQRDAQKLIDEAKQEAQKAAKVILEQAKVDAQAVSKKEIATVKARLADEEQAMTGRLSDLIILTTKAILKDSLNEKHQQEIIDFEIKQLSKLQVN